MLEDKVTVVTGSGQGIGRAICEEFGRRGAIVVVSSRADSDPKPVADAIVSAGGRAVPAICDVTVEEDVKALMEGTVEQFGRIDCLVNNAGVNFVKAFEKTTPADWDRVVNTDLRGTYLCSWYAVQHMLAAGSGVIVNIGTCHTMACLPGSAPYDAAKWGVVGLTKSMAVELSPRGIRVNALSPGLIATQMWQDIQDAAPDKQAVVDYWWSNIPMSRAGKPEEIAKAAAFLAGDDSSYMTGANVLVDGGMTSQLISREPFESKVLERG